MNGYMSDSMTKHTKKLYKVSVREIIDFIMRSGDITSVSLSDKRMTDGTKAHQKFQKQQDEYYQSEVSINHIFTYKDLKYMITGRIDGLVDSYEKTGLPMIDEIKSTGGDLTAVDGSNEMHWAQAKMYAYMFLQEDTRRKVYCRLTYIELDSFAVKQFIEEYSYEELEDYFFRIVDLYTEFAKLIDQFEHQMFTSMSQLEFPFSEIREGQAKLMKGVYRTILEGNVLFSRAPTGTGKTIATLFPGVKAIGKKITEKLFFLTAKTIGKEVAVKTINNMVLTGLQIKYTVITAKEKICIHTEYKCDPEVCPYAKGHYDRVNDVLKHMYKEEDAYTRDVVVRYAAKYRVCPYELSLDLALFSQIIICDYNYAFDPSAMLRRFFTEGSGKYTLLVDEAHNLVDRARSMYSAEIDKYCVLQMKKKVKQLDSKLYSYFEKLNKVLIDMRKELKDLDKTEIAMKEAPLEMETYLRGIIFRTEKIFKLHKHWEYKEELLEFYFLAYDFIKKYEMYGDHYISYYCRDGQNLSIKLFCIDPRPNLRELITERQGVIYFSATLLPMKYYKHLLGGDEESYGLNLLSPFESNKLKLLIDGSISTKYVDREQSLKALADRINGFIHQKQGNYIVYFPSYAYLNQGLEQFRANMMEENIEILVQERQLSEVDKENFIHAFSHEDKNKTLVAFAVLGGMFGEGIDLVGEKLSGAIIVGVGLPLICFEQDIIKNYFQEIMGQGFDYAYTYPGMNKVMQAAGRVIRTSEDIGSVLLIDRRFKSRKYEHLFPSEWFHYENIKNEKELEQALENFWRKQ